MPNRQSNINPGSTTDTKPIPKTDRTGGKPPNKPTDKSNPRQEDEKHLEECSHKASMVAIHGRHVLLTMDTKVGNWCFPAGVSDHQLNGSTAILASNGFRNYTGMDASFPKLAGRIQEIADKEYKVIDTIDIWTCDVHAMQSPKNTDEITSKWFAIDEVHRLKSLAQWISPITSLCYAKMLGWVAFYYHAANKNPNSSFNVMFNWSNDKHNKHFTDGVKACYNQELINNMIEY